MKGQNQIFFTLSLVFLVPVFNFQFTGLNSPSPNPLSSNMTNVVELKVGLHCEECIKKILKAIKKIQDIETYHVNTRFNKVTVTGNVTEEEVIRVLHKIGKTASSWDGQENDVVAAGHM